MPQAASSGGTSPPGVDEEPLGARGDFDLPGVTVDVHVLVLRLIGEGAARAAAAARDADRARLHATKGNLGKVLQELSVNPMPLCLLVIEVVVVPMDDVRWLRHWASAARRHPCGSTSAVLGPES